MISRPVFLVGAERSGTTLLRLMLDHHPDIAFLFEFQICVEKIGQDGSFPRIDEYRAWLKDNRWFQDHKLNIDESLSYSQLVDDFLVQGRNRSHGHIVGATVHYHFDRLLRIWPDARFIHLLRDGRDVARSCIAMGWYANIWSAGSLWIEAERTWDALAFRLPASSFIEVKYEDLVARPRETLTAITSFLGVPFDDVMLSYDRDSTYSPLDAANVSQWSKKLSGHEVRLIEARLGDLLARKRYPLSGQRPLHVGSAYAAWLAIRNRIGLWRFRINRYGFWLLATARIARSLPFKKLHRKLLNRQHEIDRAYIK